MPLRKIMGLDILPGESPSKGLGTRYSYVILVDGRLKKRCGEATLEEIVRVIRREKVDAIALDNIYELGEGKDDIVRLLKDLDYPPKIIQVNLINGKTYKLESIAESLNLGEGKLPPISAAEVCAKLASRGIGSEAVLFEDETRIMVRRGRSLSQGGMSKNRYRRNLELMILRITREIKEALEKNNIDFDLYTKKAEYGLENSIFIVYAPRQKLYGVVKRRKLHDVQVEIEPVSKGAIEFVPLGQKRKLQKVRNKYLILGVDPGISTGVAILSLEGLPLAVFSVRWLSRSQLIRQVSEYGKVVVVATDVNPPPLYAKKLAISFDAVLYVPQKNMSVGEKREYVSSYVEKLNLPLRIKDSHQRDALSAALRAYYHYSEKLLQVEKEVEKLNLEVPTEEIKALVIKGTSIKDAIRRVSEKYLIPELVVFRSELEKRHPSLSAEKLFRSLERRIGELLRENEMLKSRNRELRERVAELEDRIEKMITLQGGEIRKTKLYESLMHRIQALESHLEALRKELERLNSDKKELQRLFEELVRGGFSIGIGLNKLSLREVDEMQRKMEMYGRSPYNVYPVVENPNIYDSEVFNLVSRNPPKAFIFLDRVPQEVKDRLETMNVVVVEMAKGAYFKLENGLYLVDEEYLDEELRLGEERIRRKAEAVKERLRNLLQEYRKRRIAELTREPSE